MDLQQNSKIHKRDLLIPENPTPLELDVLWNKGNFSSGSINPGLVNFTSWPLEFAGDAG